MCQSKAEGGQRCSGHGPARRAASPLPVARGGARPPLGSYTAPAATPLPPMPADYQPKLSRTARLLGLDKRMTEANRRFYWYREECGYQGPINQDGQPCRVIR